MPLATRHAESPPFLICLHQLRDLVQRPCEETEPTIVSRCRRCTWRNRRRRGEPVFWTPISILMASFPLRYRFSRTPSTTRQTASPTIRNVDIPQHVYPFRHMSMLPSGRRTDHATSPAPPVAAAFRRRQPCDSAQALTIFSRPVLTPRVAFRVSITSGA